MTFNRKRETPVESRGILPSSKFHSERSSAESSCYRVGSLSWSSPAPRHQVGPCTVLKGEGVARPQLTETLHRDSHECRLEQTSNRHPPSSKESSPIPTSSTSNVLGFRLPLPVSCGLGKRKGRRGVEWEGLSPGLSSELKHQENSLTARWPQIRYGSPRGVWQAAPKPHLAHSSTWPLARQSTSTFFLFQFNLFSESTNLRLWGAKQIQEFKQRHSSGSWGPLQWKINPWQRNGQHWLAWDIMTPGWFSLMWFRSSFAWSIVLCTGRGVGMSWYGQPVGQSVIKQWLCN